ncbi:unnamed protein product [Orchesella dallaii]|uniref:Uncharacterized protein n=1 Tax=Orchesella dallaii TaxID=48710 RepID=A0ABP1R3F7_9HEXA
MSKLFVYLIIGLVVAAALTEAQEPKGSVREKRGHGHGHGGPGAGGGARGPVYFCGWVGSKEGYRSYGHGK